MSWFLGTSILSVRAEFPNCPKSIIINLTKAQIILKGTKLNVDYKLTHSCYDPSIDGLSCGECDACILRKDGFTTAGIKDPTNYIWVTR